MRERLHDAADPTFNQLLGINNAGVISGYFGSGMWLTGTRTRGTRSCGDPSKRWPAAITERRGARDRRSAPPPALPLDGRDCAAESAPHDVRHGSPSARRRVRAAARYPRPLLSGRRLAAAIPDDQPVARSRLPTRGAHLNSSRPTSGPYRDHSNNPRRLAHLTRLDVREAKSEAVDANHLIGMDCRNDAA